MERKHNNPKRTMVRMRDLTVITGCAKATIYKKIADGEFPSPVPLSDKAGGAVAWPSDVVDAWINARIDASTKAKKGGVS